MEKTVFDGKLWEAHIAWLAHCVENNILDPFEALQDLWNEHVDISRDRKGITTIIVNDMTEEQKIRQKELEEYRDKFIQERDLFTGQFILNKYGYNALTFFAQAHHSDDSIFQEWYRTIKPCEGAGHSCDLFCPIFTECKEINNFGTC